MLFKNQIVFLGDISNPACQKIRDRFHEKISDMGILDEMFIDLYAFNFDKLYQNNQPSFVYYFGKKGHQNKDEHILNLLLSNGDPIIPIFFTKGAFYDEIPKVLQIMNGKEFNIDNLDSFVNYALESLRMLRKNRRLFISYRRTDSSKIANQLFDSLIRCNYDVFLDSYSINVATNFQEELNHRLSDSDVLIQLYTEGFKNSRWCKEEIASANQKQIGVVEIVWPNVELDKHNYLCEPVILKPDCFDGNFEDVDALLNENVVNQVSIVVESVRARNMAARHDNIVGEFIKEANKHGKQIVQEYIYLVERINNTDKRIFIPAVGVPQSYDCFESLRFKSVIQQNDIEIYLIYDDLRIKKRWIEHLDWLNNSSLEVKTIKKKEFALWLQNH